MHGFKRFVPINLLIGKHPPMKKRLPIFFISLLANLSSCDLRKADNLQMLQDILFPIFISFVEISTSAVAGVTKEKGYMLGERFEFGERGRVEDGGTWNFYF